MKLKLMSMAAMALSALLCLTTSGAVAQSYEAKVFDVPASWASDETPISAADLPEDFVQITQDEAAALAVPDDGIVFLIYGFNGDNVKVLEFISGNYNEYYDVQMPRGNFIGLQTDPYNAKICYTAPASAEPTGYSVSLKEGTEDASNWQGKAGEGEYQALPLEGVAAGMAVSVKYNGTKKVKSVKAVKKAAADPLAVPLTMEALTAGTVEVGILDPYKMVPETLSTGMKYSVNGGEKTLITTVTTIPVNAGDKVQFYGNGTSTQVYGGNPLVILQGTAQTKVYGNIMSLIDETGYATLTTLPNQDNVFMALFMGNTTLTDASGLLLPATTLANMCYGYMFFGCTSLTTAPTLPATTLTEYCYYGMFYDCTSLTAAPALPATTLAGGCYSGMFDGCTSLTTAPELPATTLAESCYNSMFSGCTSLTTAPALPAETLASSCYYSMFNGCTSLSSITCLATTGINENESTDNWLNGVPATGTFNRASDATWPTGNNGIPSGWTLVPPVPAATVTTAPTAKTGVKAGQNEAIVNAGTTEGGTMMYMVNATQPASTDGFSATVPTAEGLTAGTYYVWYYVKADDDSHTDSEISATGIEVTIAAPAPKIIVLDNVTEDTVAQNGDTITGTLQGDYKISIADGATVTLKDATITCLSNDEDNANFAGITSLGDATILLEGANTVKGGYRNYPGIFAAPNATLTIDGTGSLDASSNGSGCGIGGGYGINAGDIEIKGGNVTATGADYAAGIGSGNSASCGTVTITGGTVNATGGISAAGIGSGNGNNASCGTVTITGGNITATGGDKGAGIGSGGFGGSCGAITITGGTVNATGEYRAAGIGSGNQGSCGNITIADTVTQVTATKGSQAATIGAGKSGSCGTVTIGGVEGAITESPYTYPEAN